MRCRRYLLVTACLVFAWRCPARAQSLRGELVDETTGRPIDAAFVILQDNQHVRRAGALTDAGGHFMLRAPVPGRYTLRADRIGYRSAESPALDLVADQVLQFTMRVSVEALRLEAVTARGKRRCEVHPEEGVRTAFIWEEARKALEVAVWAREQKLFAFDVAHYDRELEPVSLKQRSEKKQVTSGLWERPFVAIPAEELAAHGFVQDRPEGVIYYGPDADVLLSDVFADGHCLQYLAPDKEHAGMLGLGFQPAHERDLPDIHGVLWLDSASIELRSIEYGYTNLNLNDETNHAGGKVDFERLPSGAWIVRSWWIRTPSVVMRNQRFEFGRGRRRTVLGTFQVAQLTGFHETAGEILSVKPLAESSNDRPLAASSGASIVGSVYDSVAAKPVVGATVFLSGTSYSVKTDTAGRFIFMDLREGNFFVALEYPPLDSLMYHPPVRAVSVRVGAPAQVNVAIPGLAALRETACATRGRDTTAIVFGNVREQTSGVVLGGAHVTASWGHASSGARASASEVSVAADDNGAFKLCGLPPDTDLSIVARLTRSSGKPVTLKVGRAGFLRRDLLVP
jgi:hypothetical protein